MIPSLYCLKLYYVEDLIASSFSTELGRLWEQENLHQHVTEKKIKLDYR